MVMIDLSAAFDTVDHSILLRRLQDDFGFTGTVNRWFQSYLRDRTSRVYVKGAFSDATNLLFGVPQGSVIGPQLFTYYIRPIGHILRQHSIEYHIYADDIQLYLIFNPTVPGDAECALFRLSECVKELHSWLTINKLMMNQDKTEFFISCSSMHFKRLEHLTFNLNGLEISPSHSVKNLGVTFDYALNMSAHITTLSCSLNWQIRNLNRIRRFLTFDACHNAVRALILSRLDYCSSLFNGITKKNVNRLQRLQNKCARLIFQKPKRTHTSPLIRKLHWLPVAQRIQFRTLVHTYKSLKHSSPSYLSSLLRIPKSSYSLRSSLCTTLVTPKSNKLAGDRAFSICAPRLWNTLPVSLRNNSSIHSFKKGLKTFIFSTL